MNIEASSHVYLTLLLIHSYWRWLVLLSAVAAAGVGIVGVKSQKPFESFGKKFGLLFIIAVDVQFLLGIALYATSPYVRAALANMAVAMKQHDLRFFAVEHLATMLIATAVAHIGWVRCKKAPDDFGHYRRLSVWSIAALAIFLIGIPWWRPLFRALSFS